MKQNNFTVFDRSFFPEHFKNIYFKTDEYIHENTNNIRFLTLVKN